MTKMPGTGGHYRQMMLEEQQSSRWPETERTAGLAFRIRFYICLSLFAGYVLLDYTKSSACEVDSRRIQAEIARDMTKSLSMEVDLDALAGDVMKSIHISE